MSYQMAATLAYQQPPYNISHRSGPVFWTALDGWELPRTRRALGEPLGGRCPVPKSNSPRANWISRSHSIKPLAWLNCSENYKKKFIFFLACFVCLFEDYCAITISLYLDGVWQKSDVPTEPCFKQLYTFWFYFWTSTWNCCIYCQGNAQKMSSYLHSFWPVSTRHFHNRRGNEISCNYNKPSKYSYRRDTLADLKTALKRKIAYSIWAYTWICN